VSAGAAAGMQQIVITNDVRRWIREECKGITRLLAQILGNSPLIATGRTPCASNCESSFCMPRNSRLQNGHQYPR
jgi:hypothetical protein